MSCLKTELNISHEEWILRYQLVHNIRTPIHFGLFMKDLFMTGLFIGISQKITNESESINREMFQKKTKYSTWRMYTLSTGGLYDIRTPIRAIPVLAYVLELMSLYFPNTSLTTRQLIIIWNCKPFCAWTVP